MALALYGINVYICTSFTFFTNQMSSYIFELNDYHAVKKAEIKIDGITVLAGLNGSGKSTVARWLHHVVKVLNDYDSMVEREGVNSFMSFLSGMRRAVTSIDETGESRIMNDIYDEAKTSGITSMAETAGFYERAMVVVNKVLDNNFDKVASLDELKRYEDYFHVDISTVGNVDEYIGNAMDYLSKAYRNIVESVSEKKSARSFTEFGDKIFSIADNDIEDDSINLGFMEDGVEMITEGMFKIPLNLRNVIYIDTQKIGQAISLFGNGELSEMLNTPKSGIAPAAGAIARLIQDLIGGDVSVDKTKRSFVGSRQTYTFARKDGSSFNLRGAATGIISFSYILQLIKNGWIDDGTMLIIDEPECHLHPQWIVDYARMLVLLHKKIGAKILISSHNPDMVSAIESIARREEVQDRTYFYLSKKDENSEDRYVFHNQGNSIEEIFDSFNIAIDRINLYGECSDHTC